jgi:hypothetical protein
VIEHLVPGDCQLIRNDSLTRVQMAVTSLSSEATLLLVGHSQLWFRNPPQPGSDYELTLSLLSAGQLVEQQSVRLTPIKGPPLSSNSVTLAHGLDQGTVQLLDLSFAVPGMVPASTGAPGEPSSHIRLSPADSNIGVGLLDGAAVSCSVKGLVGQPRISCAKQGGLVVISGYAAISAGTQVNVVLTSVTTLPSNSFLALSIYIQYPSGREGFLHSPLSLQTQAGSAVTSSTCSCSVSFTPSVHASQTMSVSVTISPAMIVNPSDYILLRLAASFPASQANPVCPDCVSVEFFEAGLLRIRPLISHASGFSFTYAISNISAPLFAGDLQLAAECESYSSNKISSHCTSPPFSLSVLPCQTLTANLSSLSSKSMLDSANYTWLINIQSLEKGHYLQV